MYAVIMAGGSGTRLWPLSRKSKPKQFHSFISTSSLIQETFERLLFKFKPEEIIISTVAEYVDEIKKHLPMLPEANIIVEPSLRGNAAACGLVSAEIEKREHGASIVFLPADHAISDAQLFVDTLTFAEKMLEKNQESIVTIGIHPTKPDVGLGYIKMGQLLEEDKGFSAHEVECFVEKPDLQTAKEYLESGKYLWNAGMFTWKTDQYLKKLAKLVPATFEAVDSLANAKSPEEEKKAKNLYDNVENVSIDYAIIEKTKELIVIPGTFSWSDIGNWDALLELLSEIHGKSVVSRGNHVSLGDENSLVFSNDKLIATIGLKDIVVVDTPDALLICDRNKSSEVKTLLEKLKESDKHLHL